MKTSRPLYTTLFATTLLTACSSDEAVPGRWYTSEQVALGERIFQENCQRCHGERAGGTTADWREPLPDGRYPPPPLDGSAHAWHHPLSQLERTVHLGGAPVGGWMPAFGDKLSDQEIKAVLAYIQSLWPDRIYQAWLDRGGLN